MLFVLKVTVVTVEVALSTQQDRLCQEHTATNPVPEAIVYELLAASTALFRTGLCERGIAQV